MPEGLPKQAVEVEGMTSDIPSTMSTQVESPARAHVIGSLNRGWNCPQPSGYFRSPAVMADGENLVRSLQGQSAPASGKQLMVEYHAIIPQTRLFLKPKDMLTTPRIALNAQSLSFRLWLTLICSQGVFPYFSDYARLARAHPWGHVVPQANYPQQELCLRAHSLS